MTDRTLADGALPMPTDLPGPALRAAMLALLRRTARAEILPRFRRLSSSDIDSKSAPDDLVTVADTEAERMIERALALMVPGALIVGEEASARDPDLPGRLAHAPLGFTIDPVDGTWNFANGLACFGTMIAMTRFGRPVWGVLYDPVADNAFEAVSGGPALSRTVGRTPGTLQVSVGGRLDALSGFLPLRLIPEASRDAVAGVLPRFRHVSSLRCSCHEYRLLAQGSVDFVLSAQLTPWDHAAGSLVVQRAGGHVAMLDGSPYDVGKRKGCLLAAADLATWEALRDVFACLLPRPDGLS